MTSRKFCFLAFFLSLSSCARRVPELPLYDKVPSFTMTDSQGRPFKSASLSGKVWVADFIYTHCPGPCPRMTSQMHKLTEQLADRTDVSFVSISVDPEQDTPPVLNEFAKRFGGPTDRWVFLTGKPELVHMLAHDVFRIGDLIAVMDHSTKFILVDQRGMIRGYYSTFDAEGMPKLIEDVRALGG